MLRKLQACKRNNMSNNNNKGPININQNAIYRNTFHL